MLLSCCITTDSGETKLCLGYEWNLADHRKLLLLLVSVSTIGAELVILLRERIWRFLRARLALNGAAHLMRSVLGLLLVRMAERRVLTLKVTSTRLASHALLCVAARWIVLSVSGTGSV